MLGLTDRFKDAGQWDRRSLELQEERERLPVLQGELERLRALYDEAKRHRDNFSLSESERQRWRFRARQLGYQLKQLEETTQRLEVGAV